MSAQSGSYFDQLQPSSAREPLSVPELAPMPFVSITTTNRVAATTRTESSAWYRSSLLKGTNARNLFGEIGSTSQSVEVNAVAAASTPKTPTSIHYQERFKCDPCHSLAHSSLSLALARHQQVHPYIPPANSKPSFSCSLCSYAYYNYQGLAYHRRTMHPRVNFSKDDKEKKVKQETKQQQEQQLSVLNRRTYQCETCYRHFASQNNLYRHKRALHNKGFETFRCEFCGKKYVVKDYFKRHLRSVHNQRSKSKVLESPQMMTAAQNALTWEQNLSFGTMVQNQPVQQQMWQQAQLLEQQHQQTQQFGQQNLNNLDTAQSTSSLILPAVSPYQPKYGQHQQHLISPLEQQQQEQEWVQELQRAKRRQLEMQQRWFQMKELFAEQQQQQNLQSQQQQWHWQ